MGLRFDDRASDSAWIASVWTSTSSQVSRMTSVAGTSWGLVFWQHRGRYHAGVTGPETAATIAPVPKPAEFFGIEFAIGTSLRAVPAPVLVDGGIDLPDTTRRSFRLDGTRWSTPGPDDAEALVERLVRTGAVVRDPLVTEVLRGGRPDVSPRSVERRFKAATGLTQGALRQVERARRAARLLTAGTGAAEVVTGLGYFDEPHLARSLRRYIGRTARQLRTGDDEAAVLNLDQTPTS